MNEDLLQDLVLYKKSHEKAISAAARSLVTLFREICPSLLVKKDRGRPLDPQARPRVYGEVTVVSDIPGVELLQRDVEENSGDSDGYDESEFIGSDNQETAVNSNEQNQLPSDFSGSEAEDNDDDDVEYQEIDGIGDDSGISDDEEKAEEDEELEEADGFCIIHESIPAVKDIKSKKRKCSNFDGQLISAETSLRALKRLAEVKMVNATTVTDGILSNEDFQRIKELKAKKDEKIALTKQGLKVPSSDELTVKLVDPAILEASLYLCTFCFDLKKMLFGELV